MSGHDWDNQPLAHEVPYWMRHKYNNALMIIARNEAEVKRLRNILRTVSIDIRPQDMGDSVEWYQKLREEYGGMTNE